MKKAFTITILIASTFFASAQTTFNYHKDFKKILDKTKSGSDNLSYAKQLKRFDINDTTLTNFEILALLIGFTDKPEYKPYMDLDIERDIYQLNGDGKYQEGLEKGMSFIETHPFSVKTLFEIAYSYHKLNQEDKAEFYAFKGRKIFYAMSFSGDGKTAETPIFALGPADGQDYILKIVRAKIGSMGSGPVKNGNFLDILEAVNKDGTKATFYFVIQHATDKMFSAEDKKAMKDVIKKKEAKEKSKKKSNKK
jgi:hypothetical protein